MSELEKLGTSTCGALRGEGDSRPCVLESEHTIHEDSLGDRWTVKRGLVLEFPGQRRP